MKLDRLIAPGIGLLIILTIGLGLLFWPTGNSQTISIGQTEIAAEVVADDASRQQGLSGREDLEEGEAMLFVFDETDTHGIWMKDMNFPIDVIWLDDNKEVVYIEVDMKPNSYPTVFRPDRPARYVLEVPAGTVVKHEIMIGDEAQW